MRRQFRDIADTLTCASLVGAGCCWLPEVPGTACSNMPAHMCTHMMMPRGHLRLQMRLVHATLLSCVAAAQLWRT